MTLKKTVLNIYKMMMIIIINWNIIMNWNKKIRIINAVEVLFIC